MGAVYVRDEVIDFNREHEKSDSGFGRGVGRQTVSSEDVDAILKRYIVEQLLFIPASTKSFDRYLIMARDILDNALIRNRLSSCDTPSCLWSDRRHSSEATSA